MINNLIYVTDSFFTLYFWLILVRCLLSFVPNIDWYKQPFAAIKDVTDLYLNLFRKIIPPISGLDFSPIVAILVLQILGQTIINVLLMLK